MSHGKTRGRNGRTEQPGRLSYAQLRELAARRTAARSGRGEIPMPTDHEVSQGVTRRDFVRAGAVAAVAAASSRRAFADLQGGDTPRAAFDKCIRAMKEGAKKSGLAWAPDVEATLEQYGLPIFKENIAKWEILEPRVLDASSAIGEIASRLAGLNESERIERRHVKAAVGAVKQICTVGKSGMAAEQRWIFCPDLP